MNKPLIYHFSLSAVTFCLITRNCNTHIDKFLISIFVFTHIYHLVNPPYVVQFIALAAVNSVKTCGCFNKANIYGPAS